MVDLHYCDYSFNVSIETLINTFKNLITFPTCTSRVRIDRSKVEEMTEEVRKNEEVDNEKHNNKTRTRPSKKEALGIIAEYGTYGSFELPYCVLQ